MSSTILYILFFAQQFNAQAKYKSQMQDDFSDGKAQAVCSGIESDELRETVARVFGRHFANYSQTIFSDPLIQNSGRSPIYDCICSSWFETAAATEAPFHAAHLRIALCPWRWASFSAAILLARSPGSSLVPIFERIRSIMMSNLTASLILRSMSSIWARVICNRELPSNRFSRRMFATAGQLIVVKKQCTSSMVHSEISVDSWYSWWTGQSLGEGRKIRG